MASLHQKLEVFQSCFMSPLAPAPKRHEVVGKPSPWQARPDLYGAAFSTADDVKDKAQKLSAEATKEFEKASSAAQAKAGKIEMYSGKYYAACTFGGLMACVIASPINVP